MGKGRNYYNEGKFSKPEDSSDDNVVDDVDMTAPKPISDAPEQTEAQLGSDEDGFGGDAPKPAESGVIGRRNEDLPMENLSVPDATS